MHKTRTLRKTRETQLMVVAGLVTGAILAAQANLHEILRWDRLQHSVFSMVLFFVFYGLLWGQKHQTRLAIAITLLIGVGKEMVDHQAQGFDMVANTFGVVIGLILATVALGMSSKTLSH